MRSMRPPAAAIRRHMRSWRAARAGSGIRPRLTADWVVTATRRGVGGEPGAEDPDGAGPAGQPEDSAALEEGPAMAERAGEDERAEEGGEGEQGRGRDEAVEGALEEAVDAGDGRLVGGAGG